MAECDVCGGVFETAKQLEGHKSNGHNQPWRDRDRLVKEYVENGRSSYDLADEWGCDPKTVRNWLDEYGIEKREAKDYLRVEYVNYATTEDGYERWQLCYGDDRGESVMVHRLAAVAWFGLDKIRGKHVHHDNGVTWDNRPDNFDFPTPSEHIKLHQEDGEIPTGPDAQQKGGYDPDGLFVGLPNEDRYQGMYEEMAGVDPDD